MGVKKIINFIITGHRGAKGNKGDSIDRILEVDKATKMTGNVTNDSCAKTDEDNGNNEGGVSVVDG